MDAFMQEYGRVIGAALISIAIVVLLVIGVVVAIGAGVRRGIEQARRDAGGEPPRRAPAQRRDFNIVP